LIFLRIFTSKYGEYSGDVDTIAHSTAGSAEVLEGILV